MAINVTKHDAIKERIKRLLEERNGMLPVWVRAPNQGPEFFSGLTRAKLYELWSKGLIQSKSIREPGKERGCRLFNLPSILAYIDSCEEAA